MLIYWRELKRRYYKLDIIPLTCCCINNHSKIKQLKGAIFVLLMNMQVWNNSAEMAHHFSILQKLECLKGQGLELTGRLIHRIDFDYQQGHQLRLSARTPLYGFPISPAFPHNMLTFSRSNTPRNKDKLLIELVNIKEPEIARLKGKLLLISRLSKRQMMLKLMCDFQTELNPLYLLSPSLI